jgi:hypothetical protein
MAEPDPNLHLVLVALDSVADFIGHESNAQPECSYTQRA